MNTFVVVRIRIYQTILKFLTGVVRPASLRCSPLLLGCLLGLILLHKRSLIFSSMHIFSNIVFASPTAHNKVVLFRLKDWANSTMLLDIFLADFPSIRSFVPA